MTKVERSTKFCFVGSRRLSSRHKRKSSIEDSKHENVTARKYSCQQKTAFFFFCAGNASAAESLREAAKLRLDSQVRKCAYDLQDKSLLAKLSAGDMMTLEAKYHLYNWAAALQTEDQHSKTDKLNHHGIVLAELLAH